MYFFGCDVQVNTILRCNFNNNRRWGVYDDGFLGNTYINNQFTANGVQNQYSVTVTYKGKTYAAINPDSMINKNKRPDISTAYWYDVGAMQTRGAWDSTISYKSGGSLFVVSVSARTVLLGTYCEDYQPVMQLGVGTLNLGGIGAVGYGTNILSNYTGLVLKGGAPGRDVNVVKSNLNINKTDNDVNPYGELNIAATDNPSILLGGTSMQNGATNNTASFVFRSKINPKANLKNFLLRHDAGTGLLFYPDALYGSPASLILKNSGEVQLPNLAGAGREMLTLDVNGETKRGPLKLTTAAKLALKGIAAGTIVYDTTLNQYSYWNTKNWVNY